MTMDDQRSQLLAQVAHLVRFHQGLGIDAYPFNEGVKAFLSQRRETSRQATSDLPRLTDRISGCRRCRAAGGPLVGQGDGRSGLMIVGSVATLEEIKAATPFPGGQGELLDRMLQAIGLDRASVYITPLAKCAPSSEEGKTSLVANCLGHLKSEVAVVAPRAILAMGAEAAAALLGRRESITRLRGKFHLFQEVPVMPTFSPDELLRRPELKKGAWIDLQLVQKRLKRRKAG